MTPEDGDSIEDRKAEAAFNEYHDELERETRKEYRREIKPCCPDYIGNREDLSVVTKDTNPKDAVGMSKSPLSVISTPALHAIGLAMMEGARKYGRHNYRKAGIRYSVYYDAVMRHMNAWWEGEDFDKDSGLPHPIKAAACLTILYDALLAENGTDDRPPKSPAGWMDKMNEYAKAITKKYPDAKPPITELD